MHSSGRHVSPLPPEVAKAVVESISAARLADIPILDVEMVACAVAGGVPEAAVVDARTLRDEIARIASREPGMGLAWPARPK